MADDDTDFDLDDFAGGEPTGRGGGAGPSEDGGAGRWPWLLVGIALGVAGAVLVPRYVAPHLPASLGGGLVSVQGEVLDKERESGRLLLTLDSERGAMLATFRDRISELDLLIGRGDTVTLAMAEFRPFVDDPRLVGVKKGRWEGRVPATPPPTGEGDTAAEEDTAGAAPGDTGPGVRRRGGREAAPDTLGAPAGDDSAGGAEPETPGPTRRTPRGPPGRRREAPSPGVSADRPAGPPPPQGLRG